MNCPHVPNISPRRAIAPSDAVKTFCIPLKRRRFREDAYALAVDARGMVVCVDGHVDVPLVGLEELKVEAGNEGGDAHVEFCVCETGVEEEVSLTHWV